MVFTISPDDELQDTQTPQEVHKILKDIFADTAIQRTLALLQDQQLLTVEFAIRCYTSIRFTAPSDDENLKTYASLLSESFGKSSCTAQTKIDPDTGLHTIIPSRSPCSAIIEKIDDTIQKYKAS